MVLWVQMAEIQAFGIVLCVKNNTDLCSNCKWELFQLVLLGLWYRKFKALLLLSVTQKSGVTAEATSKSNTTEVKTEDKFYWLEWICSLCVKYIFCAHRLTNLGHGQSLNHRSSYFPFPIPSSFFVVCCFFSVNSLYLFRWEKQVIA